MTGAIICHHHIDDGVDYASRIFHMTTASVYAIVRNDLLTCKENARGPERDRAWTKPESRLRPLDPRWRAFYVSSMSAISGSSISSIRREDYDVCSSTRTISARACRLSMTPGVARLNEPHQHADIYVGMPSQDRKHISLQRQFNMMLLRSIRDQILYTHRKLQVTR